MMDLFVGGETDRTVFWLGPPTMRDRNWTRACSRSTASCAKRPRSAARTSSTSTPTRMFSDENGEYADRLDVPVGPSRPARRRASGADLRRRALHAGRRRVPRDTGVLAARQPLPAHRAGRRRRSRSTTRSPKGSETRRTRAAAAPAAATGTGSGTTSGTRIRHRHHEVDGDDRADGREHADDAGRRRRTTDDRRRHADPTPPADPPTRRRPPRQTP